MNQGNFFRLGNSSRLEKGLVYFRYLPLVRRSKKTKRSESDYPIYLSISKSSITFYIQRRNKESGENETPYYQHTELFSLPLMMNLRSRDNLQKTMNEVFVGKEPFNKSEYSFPFPDYNKDSYSDLGGDVFGNFLDFKNKNEINLSLEYKRIFLDFLFDLEHSTVFKNSPYYEQMEESLREDAFFTALSAKAEYYYIRKYSLRFFNYDDKTKLQDFLFFFRRRTLKLVNLTNIEKAKHIANNYLQAMATWLNKIRLADAEEMFYNSQWFNSDIEKEYKAVVLGKNSKTLIFWTKEILNNKDARKRIKHIKISSNKWFIRRYAWFSAFRCKILDLNIILPRLIMATASAWILFVTTEEIWKTTVDTSLDSSRWILGLMLIPILFLINEIRNIALHKKAIHYFGRTILILVLGYIISFSIGWFFTKNTSEKMLVRSGYLPDLYIEKLNNGDSAWIDDADFDDLIAEFSPDASLDSDTSKASAILAYLKNNDINISGHQVLYENLHVLKPYIGCESNVPIKCKDKDVFPHLLFFRAFLALFVGLFLQLVFEDKPVTEPL